MDDRAGWLPWNLAVHIIAFSIPIAGLLFAAAGYSAMIARMRDENPDSTLVTFDPFRRGSRHQRRTALIWMYIDEYGADANSVGCVGGGILAVVGFIYFSQIDATLMRLAAAVAQTLGAFRM